MTTIQTKITEELANTLSQRTQVKVIEHFAEIEAKKQAEALIEGINKISELSKDLSKIKPKHTSYNAEGTPIGEASFTKADIDAKVKLQQKLHKWTKAVDKADDQNDFQDLYNLLKGKTDVSENAQQTNTNQS